MKEKKYLITIVGPTAIGKTALSIQLAKHFSTEIISADSRQFFKEISIGTAKPKDEEMQGVKHHFINSHSISEDYNVGKYEKDAIDLIENIFENKNTVIVVGGSGLYIDAICKGLDELPKANEEIRNKINNILKYEGIEGLQKLLKQLDESYYNQVDLQNPQRLSRAIEVCLSTGKTYSSLRKEKNKTRNFNIIKIGLEIERTELYSRINARVDEMITQGLLDEVKSVLSLKHLNALQTVGYKELFDYFENKTDLKTTIELIKQHTRNFAKRQLTWFKRDEEIKWFKPSETDKIIEHINLCFQ